MGWIWIHKQRLGLFLFPLKFKNFVNHCKYFKGFSELLLNAITFQTLQVARTRISETLAKTSWQAKQFLELE